MKLSKHFKENANTRNQNNYIIECKRCGSHYVDVSCTIDETVIFDCQDCNNEYEKHIFTWEDSTL